MVFKCPSCGFRGTHKSVQSHYYKKHYKSKKGSASNKSKDKKVYIFKPLRRK
jgi:hypothetical protein